MPFVTHLAENPEMNQADLERLLKDPKAAFEFRILRATRRLLARKGLSISVDEIAEEAEVGRRTVFRYFESRDELVARALDESLDRFYTSVTETSAVDMPLADWLANIVGALHSQQLAAGAGLWQLAATQDEDLPAPIAKINRKRRASRKKSTGQISDAAWARAGGTGGAPHDVEIAFANAISAFTVQSMHRDYGATFDEATRVVADTLHAYLVAKVAR